MKKLFWKAVLYMLRQIGSTDINEQLLRENEYIRAELQIVKAQLRKIKKRPSFTGEQRKLLAEKGKAIGKRLYDLATIVTPSTILRWHRQLVAKKFDSSQSPKRKTGRTPTPRNIEDLILTMALDNPSWGYLRIAGALKNLGFKISRTTIANIMKNNGINPSGDRKHGGISWADFIRLHKDLIWASDFFCAEVWTKFGLFTYYILFFIDIASRRIVIGGITESQLNILFMTAIRNTPDNSMQS